MHSERDIWGLMRKIFQDRFNVLCRELEQANFNIHKAGSEGEIRTLKLEVEVLKGRREEVKTLAEKLMMKLIDPTKPRKNKIYNAGEES